MQELLNKLKELSNRYEKLSNALGLNDDCEEEFSMILMKQLMWGEVKHIGARTLNWIN